MKSLVKIGLFLVVGLATSEVASACCFESDVIEFFSCSNLQKHCFADTATRGCNRAIPSDYQCHQITVYCCQGGGQQYQTTDTSVACGTHCGSHPCLPTATATRTKKRGQPVLLLSDDISIACNGCQ